MEVSNLFVCLMGMGIVFAGLACIIGLVTLMGVICQKLVKETPKQEVKAAPQAAAPIANRQEMNAAVSAVIAEELGTNVSGLRIVSFKKV